MKSSPYLLFSTERYCYLKNKILSVSDVEEGITEVKKFPDGERYMRLLSDVSERHVLLLGGTVSDADTMEIYDLASGIVKYGAISLTIIIPYFGYSTMERAVMHGEIVTAKNRATLLSSIPRTSLGNKIVCIDLHTEGIPHYFESNIRPIHLYSKEVIIKACYELYGKDFVLASTDSGRAKWVESLANDMQVNGAFVFKRRISEHQTEVTGISADVKNKNVIIYDDMIRTGSSIINAAEAYSKAGAKRISIVATHGLFVQDSLSKLASTQLFEKIICTDTHSNVQHIVHPLLEVKTVARLIKDNIEKHFRY
ncbi:MAG: ribose-phosphate diphosphokinase [Cytophagaceae bacterium]|nr:ribose-phosphate diphosphokinase [Cytophagaceae bacterium]MDW8457298.1 ribose-phosphate diphosphokinase [Cytophagaceae bacterium]